MITVHHLENSQSIRILWLLEELNVDYQLQHYKRVGPQTLAPEEYKKLHVIGTSPTITDQDLVLPETGAIMDYILDKYPSSTLRPEPNSSQRVRYLYWMHATQASFMPLMLDALIFKRMVSKVPFFLKPIMSLVVNKVRDGYLWVRYHHHLRYMDQELSQSTWLSGEELTAADIAMGYCLEVAEIRVGIGKEYPNVHEFLNRMRQRPAYQRAIEKGGRFTPLAE
ncbi:glutathione S-transferase [Vibrio sp. D420a]|uniref:glutathione S-transferase family protein n=1 Tax=Vibrio sp. D420a TaxID=2836895 RepID=UPI0025552848|nr:glutathione S-transferase [Vibrio sp. D420a]MDK9762044.1 glutathione S-transferase [Vibrio sp. D420a]